MQLRYAAALARLSQLALGLPLVSDLLDAATSLGANALEAGLGVWLERDGDGLRIQAETGLGAERRGSAVPLDGSLAGLAWTRRVPVDGAQLQGEPLRRDTLLAAAGAACALAVPVCGVDRVHGVLLLAGTTPRTFEPEDVHFAETVGNVLGTALDYRASQEALSRREGSRAPSSTTRATASYSGRRWLLRRREPGGSRDARRRAARPPRQASADVVATSLDLASDGRTTVPL